MELTTRIPRALAAGLLLTAVSCHRQAAPPASAFVVEDLGRPPTPRSVIATAVDGAVALGTVYETRGEGRLLRIELPDGRSRELPMAGTAGAYVIALDRARHLAYIGTFRSAQVWRYDIARDTLAPLPGLDRVLAADTHIFTLALVGDRLYAGTYPTGRLIAYDIAAGTAVDEGPALAGRAYLRQLVVGRSGRLYAALGTPAAVVSHAPGPGAFTPVATAQDAATAFATLVSRGKDLVAYAGGAEVVLPGEAPEGGGPAMTVGDDGRYAVTIEGRAFSGRVDLAPKQAGMGSMGLFPGPDGAVLGSTYWNTHLFRVDEDGHMTSLGRVRGAQGEFRKGVPLDDHQLLLPGYDGAMFLYDLRRPWSVEAADANPRSLGAIGAGQHLANAVDRRSDGLVAIATPPTYGQRGGALTLLQGNTLAWKTHPRVAGDQALAAVCFGPDGKVYAGTSTEVGLGAEPVAGPARLLVIEPASGEVLSSTTPLRGASGILGLVALGDRGVLGAGDDGSLFLVNPRRGRARVVHRFEHQVRDLAWWPAVHAVLAVVWSEGLYRIDPDTLAVTLITGSPRKALPGLAFDARGRAYAHDGNRVYRIAASGQ